MSKIADVLVKFRSSQGRLTNVTFYRSLTARVADNFAPVDASMRDHLGEYPGLLENPGFLEAIGRDAGKGMRLLTEHYELRWYHRVEV